VRAALVYVSDHGQNFRNAAVPYTHGSTRSAYEVPLLVWGMPPCVSSSRRVGTIAEGGRPCRGPWRQSAPDQSALHGRGQDLLGYQVHAVDKGTASHVSPAGDGPYPPTAAHNGCDDWFAQVAQRHPAATP
jgi:hypothetical protein